MTRPQRLPRWLDLGDALTPCRSNPAVFFPENQKELAQAQALCAICDHKVDCLTGALQRNEQSGVWGMVLFHNDKRRMAFPYRRPRAA
ncbi:WhiB family transcriptional regulator [Tessaracoccus sp.]